MWLRLCTFAAFLALIPNPGLFPGFFRNPVVHSLSVTLSNHTNLGNQPYNGRVRKAIPQAAELPMDG